MENNEKHKEIVKTEPYCPICGKPEENRGSINIKICEECQKIFDI
jgi:ribosomal protein L37AE/L43A